MGLALLINFTWIISNSARDIKRIYQMGFSDSIWRGVAFHNGERAANYILFLRTHLPETSEVIYPTLSTENSNPIFSTPALQFYLFPRLVRNCLTMDCVKQAAGRSPVLYFNDSQEAVFNNEHSKTIKFDTRWGVILPNTFKWSTNSADPHAQRNNLLWEFCRFLLGIIGLTFFGQQLVALFIDEPILEQSALGFGIGLACFSMSLAMTSLWLGSITPVHVLANYLFYVSLGGLSLFVNHQNRKKPNLGFSLPRISPWAVTYFLLALLAATLAIGKGYAVTDEIQIWGLKGYGIALTGKVQSITQWGTNTSAYPLNIPILIAAIKSLLGDHLPSAKLLFSLFYLGLLIVWDGGLKRMGLNYPLRGVFTLLLGSTPLVFRHASLAYANLPFCFYLFSGGTLFFEGLQVGRSTGDIVGKENSIQVNHKRTLLGIFLLIAAAWTRPEGLILTLTVIISGLIASQWQLFYPFRSWLAIAIPIVCYGLFWWLIKNKVYPHTMKDVEILRIALNQISQGNFHLSQGLYLIKQAFLRLLRLDIWGVNGIVLIGLGGFGYFFRNKHSLDKNHYFLSGFLITLIIFGIYFILSFDRKHDLSWWVNTGFDRMWLPAFLFLLYGLIAFAIPPKSDQR